MKDDISQIIADANNKQITICEEILRSQFQTSLYNQLVSERTQARKSAMAGNFLKSSWLWRGYNKEIGR